LSVIPDNTLALRRVIRCQTAVATAAILLALAITPALSIQPVNAQAQPPNRFYGTVSINGQDQPEGTVVEAYIGNTLCGSGTVQNRNGSNIYLVDVLGSGQKPNCANDGDKVTFKISGLDANETGSYDTAAATRLDLTAAGAARTVAQPTVLAPGTGGTPAPPPPLPTSPLGTSTPAPTFTPSPDQASETPVTTPTETPTASATAPAPTATTSPTPASNTSATSTSSSTSRRPISIIVLVLLILAVALGVGALLYFRRNQL
jgi:hypothetical protein